MTMAGVRGGGREEGGRGFMDLRGLMVGSAGPLVSCITSYRSYGVPAAQQGHWTDDTCVELKGGMV